MKPNVDEYLRLALKNNAIIDGKLILGWNAQSKNKQDKQSDMCITPLGENWHCRYGNAYSYSTALDEILNQFSQQKYMDDFKVIKFTKENAEKHLKLSDRYILTGRDNIKGEVGEYVKLENIYGIWKITHIYEPLGVVEYAQRFFCEEGFENALELSSELKRIYGDDAKIYGHKLENTEPKWI